MESPTYAGAGLILLSQDALSVLLVCDARSHKWGFPKGHRETEDASDLLTAVREVREEVGLETSSYTVVDSPFRLTRGSASYIFRYALMKDGTHVLTPRHGEIEHIAWAPVASLLGETCDYAGNKYLRTWIADLKNEAVRRKSVLLYTGLLRSKPLLEPVRSSHSITRA